MRKIILNIDRGGIETLQVKIRQALVASMLSGSLPPDSRLPSSRALAKQLNVARNTVLLVYQSLIDDGYVVAHERSGFFVTSNLPTQGMTAPAVRPPDADEAAKAPPFDWEKALRISPSSDRNIVKPNNWHHYPYPFIFGQPDPTLFPIGAWRDCMRQAMSVRWLESWTDDRYTYDDTELIEQIRVRVLPGRGLYAQQDEVLVTLGAQNALYLAARLLADRQTEIAFEDPGYSDARNIFSLISDQVHGVPVDEDGIRVDRLGKARIVYVTPRQQVPPNITMSLDRRMELLDWARRNGSILIEDDYETEMSYMSQTKPALKSLDALGQVIYTGSLSKSFIPSLRIGYLVGPAPFIREARALRRLLLRHPPSNNQRAVSLFLSLGHHDSAVARLHREYAQRWRCLGDALAEYLPEASYPNTSGGTSYWLRLPRGVSSSRLAAEALKQGVVIEPGQVYFTDPAKGEQYIRLGFSAIRTQDIPTGIKILADLAHGMMNERSG